MVGWGFGGVGMWHDQGSLPLLLQHVGLIQMLIPVLLSEQPGGQKFLELDPGPFCLRWRSPHIISFQALAG